jgi:hypothetical protein
MAVAGVASTIPLEVHAEEPEADIVDGWNVTNVTFPSRILGLRRYASVLVIATEFHGVWIIPEGDIHVIEHVIQEDEVTLRLAPGEDPADLRLEHLGDFRIAGFTELWPRTIQAQLALRLL